MKTERNILIAFILNTIFSIAEFVGGVLIGSVAITSDAVHDLGDAISVGTSYFLERKSKGKPDEKYTYGYVRFSVLGGLITTLVLLIGSAVAVYGAINKIISPTPINYNGMIIFAIVGVIVNFISALVTHGGKSLNQKAVNLHMLEDVLGWIVVLIGAIVMRFTGFYLLDSIMCIGLALFISVSAIKNLKEIFEIFLIKTPKIVSVAHVKEHAESVSGVDSVHHIHLWTLDGINTCLTMHVVVSGDFQTVKKAVKEELKEHGICHSTLELEKIGEECDSINCTTGISEKNNHHCHHRHH